MGAFISAWQNQKQERWKLILRQIGREFCFAANLNLIDRDGHEFIAYAQEASDREDHSCNGCMVEIHQHTSIWPMEVSPL